MATVAYPSLYDDVLNQERTNIVGIISFTILVWDHAVTFRDEVEYIWIQNKGPIIYLFFIARYVVPISFIINLYAYLSPAWTTVMCDKFVRYEGGMHAAQIYLVAVMMMLRVRALYNERWWISWGLALLIVCEVGVSAFLLVHGQAVVHNPGSGVEACTMIFNNTMSVFVSSLFAWLPLLYDSIILGLTLYRTIPAIRGRRAGIILNRLFADGILYFIVIFSLALTFALMIILAPPGIKNITGQSTQLLTVAMMSRITLHLKRLGTKTVVYNADTGEMKVFQNQSYGVGTSTYRTIRFSETVAERHNALGDDTASLSELVPEGQKVRRPSAAFQDYKTELDEQKNIDGNRNSVKFV